MSRLSCVFLTRAKLERTLSRVDSNNYYNIFPLFSLPHPSMEAREGQTLPQHDGRGVLPEEYYTSRHRTRSSYAIYEDQYVVIS